MRVQANLRGDPLPAAGVRSSSGMEALEPRALLSVASPVAHTHLHFTPSSGADTFAGYSPAQIRHAYGFDRITLGQGHLTGDGAGQTIAIIDAYDNSTIQADLQVFDAKFGLADPPQFTQVNQTGGSQLPATDSAWASEIALDVEWAHALAPAANILLVEANSDSLDDLMAAVDFARHQAGVSAISMSWGGGEFAGETGYDPIFSTPADHVGGITFVASSGDGGSRHGIEWPAASPNVLSVGGTTLQTADAAGNWKHESGWSGSGGGSSRFEHTPAYQANVGAGVHRYVPDVSMVADPQTGVAIYNSQSGGWLVGGGTSAGAPQWAALMAITNQGRAQANQPTLDGATQTLPSLYQTDAPSDGSTSTYSDNFHDVTTGQSSTAVAAQLGYDPVTGLGTPKAAAVVTTLQLAPEPAATSSKTTTTASTPTATTTTQSSAKKRRAHPNAQRRGGQATTATPATSQRSNSSSSSSSEQTVAPDFVDLSHLPAAALADFGNATLVPDLALATAGKLNPLGLHEASSADRLLIASTGPLFTSTFPQLNSNAIGLFSAAAHVTETAAPLIATSLREAGAHAASLWSMVGIGLPDWLTVSPGGEYAFSDSELVFKTSVLILSVSGLVAGFSGYLRITSARRRAEAAAKADLYRLFGWREAF